MACTRLPPRARRSSDGSPSPEKAARLLVETDADAILPLRHAVLRPGHPLEDARFPADAAPGTRHWAAYDGERLIGCATLQRAPARVRYSGASLGYQLASITAGGPAPLIAPWLLQRFGSSMAIAGHVAAMVLVSMGAALALPDRAREAIDQAVAEAPVEAARA